MSETSIAELSPEITGASTVESTGISQKELDLAREIGEEINAGILKDYGSYMPESTNTRSSKIVSGIALVSDVETTRRERAGVDMNDRQTNEYEMGYADRKSGKTFILSPDIAWMRFSRSDRPDTPLGAYLKRIHESYLALASGDEQKARELFGEDYLRNTMTHELLHQYEGNHSDRISEPPTTYYTKEYLNRHNIPVMGGMADLREEEGYRNVVTEFGDKAHRWYFGGEVGFFQKRAITSRVNQVIATSNALS